MHSVSNNHVCHPCFVVSCHRSESLISHPNATFVPWLPWLIRYRKSQDDSLENDLNNSEFDELQKVNTQSSSNIPACLSTCASLTSSLTYTHPPCLLGHAATCTSTRITVVESVGNTRSPLAQSLTTCPFYSLRPPVLLVLPNVVSFGRGGCSAT